MPTIPKGFKPVVENYAIGSPDGVMRTEVAGGSPRYAMEWDRGVQQFRVTLILTAFEFSVWSTFFHHTIKKGAISFDMDLDSGYGVHSHTVDILPGTYTATPTGGRAVWTVSFTVEAESAAYAMSAVDAAALLALYDLEGARSIALLDRIDVFANHDTLVLGLVAPAPAPAPAPGPAPAPAPSIAVADWDGVILQDSDSFIDTNIWGPGSLTRGTYTGLGGTQYEQKIGIESPAKWPGNGPATMRATWGWPTGTTEVKSFPAVIAGNRPGWYNSWTGPGGYPIRLPDGSTSGAYPSGRTPNSLFPLALPVSGPLSAAYSFTRNQAPTGRGHLSYDIWLQSSPTQVNGFTAPPVATEIMIPLDNWGSPYPYGAYVPGGGGRSPSWYWGDDTIDGRNWHIFQTATATNAAGGAKSNYFNGEWNLIVFQPDVASMPPAAGSLNIAAFINYAISKGWTTAGVSPHGVAATHVVSVELGVEPVEGTGDMTWSNYVTQT